MKRQKLSVTDILALILVVPFCLFIISATGWLFLLVMFSSDSDEVKPALVHIRRTLAPLPVVQTAETAAVPIAEPPRPETHNQPASITVDPQFDQSDRDAGPTTVEPVEPVSEAPIAATIVENDSEPVSSTSGEAAVAEPLDVAETTLPTEELTEPETVSEVEQPVEETTPVAVVDEQPVDDSLAEAETSTTIVPDIEANWEVTALESVAPPPPSAPPPPPLFDPTAPPDVSFFDQLLEQVEQ